MKRLITHSTKASDIKRKWYLVDAKGKTLGRFAGKVARIIMGKDKVNFTPHLDTGDFVIVINASDIMVTGKKESQKTYFSHSGYPGGDKLLNFKHLIIRQPQRIIKQAVWGMLPQNRLGKAMLKKLKIYADARHGHEAQKPEQIDI
ncbi:MAG: 50S ribosomal protein L13 [bacterium]